MVEEARDNMIDDMISMVEGGWEFTSEVAEHFDSHVRKSIPLYEELQHMTADISDWFIHNDSTVYDLGSATGETIHQLQKRHALKKNARFIGIDNSKAMVKHAQDKVSAKNVKFLCQDLVHTRFLPADLVISLYTLQFLDFPNRIKILQSVYQCLRPGGALIIAEKVLPDDGRFNEMWLELYWDFKKRKGLTDDQILHKSRSIRGILRPLTLAENIDLLKKTGFNSIDIFLKWYNFAGILAIKTTASPNESASPVSNDNQDIKSDRQKTVLENRNENES